VVTASVLIPLSLALADRWSTLLVRSEGPVIVDFTPNDPRTGDSIAILRFDVIDDDDFERIQISILSDAINFFRAFSGFGRDDEVLEARFGRNAGSLIELSDLEFTIVAIRNLFEFAVEGTLSFIE
jgi:hypothetical protein